MGWVKNEVKADSEIFASLKSVLSANYIKSKSYNNNETPYGFVGDYIKDYYDVTLSQCDRLTKMVLEYFEIDKPQKCRYEVHLYQCNENADVIDDGAVHFETNSIKEAFARAAMFYRDTEFPQVNIYDNEKGEYIAEWDGYSADY